MFHENGLIESSRSLLSNCDPRPTPQHMAKLILGGLTESHLYDAWDSLGNQAPSMDQSLTEVETLLPFIHLVSDTLASGSSDNETLLFAARDAEMMYDDFNIAYGDHLADHSLIPASQSLWNSNTWRFQRLGRMFLSQHGISEQSVQDPEINFALVDTGYLGTIARLLDESSTVLYGRSLLSCGRLVAKLACADPKGIGQQIADAPHLDKPRLDLPKASRFATPSKFRKQGSAYLLATALQLAPRYHGAFNGITYQEGRAVATIRHEAIDLDIDAPRYCRETVNDSLVNPLAAAIVQYRVVSSALIRRPVVTNKRNKVRVALMT